MITSHHLRVPNLETLPAFYGEILGMRTIERTPETVSFSVGPRCAHLTFHRADVRTADATDNDFYWKIGITVRDLDAAVSYLRSRAIDLPEPVQFRDIGYMSRIVDPNGLNIELLQQGFQGNEKPLSPGNPIGQQAILAHITVRVTNISAATEFFCGELGMRLMSVQPVEERGFCLYFFAWTDDVLPNPDLESVDNREWLWARPYTFIEVQHLQSPGARVRRPAAEAAGFAGFGYAEHRDDTENLVTVTDLADYTLATHGDTGDSDRRS